MECYINCFIRSSSEIFIEVIRHGSQITIPWFFQMFSFDESKYISDFKFFGKALEEDEDDEEDVDEREDKNETLQQTSGQNKFSD